jgi:phosphoheptose isomerase
VTRRIALISEHASPLAAPGGVDSGGQNVYVAQVARGLALEGYQVDVFTRRDSPCLPEVMPWIEAVRIVHVPAGPPTPIPKHRLLPWMADFADYLRARAGQYDLLHANFWMSGLVAAEVKRSLGVPFVVTFHALGRVRRLHLGEQDESPVERLAIEDRVVAEADGLIAECPQDQDDLIRLYDADPSRVRVIPCGFDPAELWPVDQALARTALGLDPTERVLLELGRVVPRKGMDVGIRALGLLERAYGLRARLLVVGGESEEPDPCCTPELARLAEVARTEGVADQVTFVGRRDRAALKYYYSAADVFVSTPWYEPFGLTPVEAMACGTPVIGSNVGGIKLTVADCQTGYLVPANDPAAVAECLARLYRHPRLRACFSAQALARARAQLTWERVTNDLVRFYDDVTGRGSHAAERGLVGNAFDQAAGVLAESARRLHVPLVTAADVVAACLLRGGKLLVCGNGGSAAEAQHLAAEMVGRFVEPDRPGLPAVALTADGAVVTAWANDRGYAEVFARQVAALGRPDDVLIGLSTSGRSSNVVRAFETAHGQGLRTVALLGGDGGDVRHLADVALVVPSADTQRIQEIHTLLVHVLCGLVERRLTHAPSKRLLVQA